MKNRTTLGYSELYSDYEAPVTGYASAVQFEDTNGFSPKTDYKMAKVQCFRIHSRNKGSSKQLYGKIYGNLLEMRESGPVLKLDYLYINTEEGSRNMEFDRTQNLAPSYKPVVPKNAFMVDLS